MGTPESCKSEELCTELLQSQTGVTSTSTGSVTQNLRLQVFGVLHWVVSLGFILAIDFLLKKAFAAASIEFPSALFGMFCIFSVLIILDYAVPSAAVAFEKFFEPGIIFIQRWLPLFYVPYLVVLPLSLKDIPASSAIKICFIVVGGWLATVCVTGLTAIGVRKAVKTELIDAEPMEKPSPFSSIEVWAWTGVLLISFAASLVFPSALGTRARTYLPFLLASSVRLHDWLRIAIKLEEGLPPNNFLCSIAELAAIALGFLSKSGLDAVLGYYLTNSSSNPGVGYIVMGFLGSVILSFAFSMFKQRKLVKRHAAEIFTCHNLYHILIVLNCHCWMSTCFRTIITVSILPRCITVALALSIVSFFEGATSVTSLVWENRHA